MKQFKMILRTLLIIFVSLVVGFNLYTWNAQSLMGNTLPMPFGYGAAVVLTGSMEPTIHVNDVILVAEQPTYAENEIAVYQSGSILVVHRILDITDGMVTTKGDANNAPDAPVELSAVKGKVVGVIPGVGSIVKILKTPTATAIMLVGAVLLLEASFRKEKKKGDDQLEKIKEEIRKLKDEQQ
jgi:signal peptidase